MWIFTTRGFFSVVSHRDDPEKVLVRARAREDLESLADLIGDLEVIATPSHDYAFRAYVDRRAWSAALVLLAAEIDYPNFKDEVAERQGHARADLYLTVWSAMRGLQRAAQ